MLMDTYTFEHIKSSQEVIDKKNLYNKIKNYNIYIQDIEELNNYIISLNDNSIFKLKIVCGSVLYNNNINVNEILIGYCDPKITETYSELCRIKLSEDNYYLLIHNVSIKPSKIYLCDQIYGCVDCIKYLIEKDIKKIEKAYG